ncbi:MAG: hypothetical protein OJF49_002948 [Ktedonobacterales bacterium]|nr:MAG: hypothetical protein OJF49_002948 [Ktedonobacterales bacterium]
MRDYTQANRGVWNAWTDHHTASDHHADVATFRASGSSLRGIERDELGNVAGKSLLHLQCNMGSDTLSWARLGAHVTGVDIADAAIARARELAAETGLDARFICSDLYALPAALNEQFDIVFTSYGAVCWMSDLTRWAEVVARYVRPGGVFYMVEMHPFANMLAAADDGTNTDAERFAARYPYFHNMEPVAEDVRATTGDPEHGTVFAWSYGLGEVITALIAAGLRLEYVHEFPLAHYQRFLALARGERGYWRWPDARATLPMLFSLRATK